MTMHRTTPAATAAVFASLLVAAAVVAAAAGQRRDGDLLDAVLDRCSLGPGAVGCLKSSVLEYLGGARDGRDGRSLDSDELDAELVKAAGEYVERQVYELDVAPGAGRAMDDGATNAQQQQQQQPAATTTTTTARGLDQINLITVLEFLKVLRSVFKLALSFLTLKKSELNLAFIPFVADMEMGMMQDKMLMPLMMMLKLKLKMLTPIMMALVSMKATKALILSKVAIFLVLGFLVKEFLKKSGGIPGLPLHLPGFPGSEPPSSTASPPPMYGPPQSSGYESASSWEPSGYSSGHSPSSSSSDSSHSMAYSSYLPSSSSSSSSGSLSATKY